MATIQAEILMIGTELLLGQIEDTNATHIAQVLADNGINLYQKTTVGDNHDRICDALREALSRSDVVLCSGGLGPTEDDITRECVAEVTDRPLEDVNDLFRLNYAVLLGTLGYALSYVGVSYILGRRGFGRRMARVVIAGGVLTLLLMLAAGLATFFNFDGFFYQFHVFSFANDLWQLDPATDFLVMLFPQGFWYDAAVAVTLVTTTAALALSGGAWLYLRKTRGNGGDNNDPEQ